MDNDKLGYITTDEGKELIDNAFDTIDKLNKVNPNKPLKQAVNFGSKTTRKDMKNYYENTIGAYGENFNQAINDIYNGTGLSVNFDGSETPTTSTQPPTTQTSNATQTSPTTQPTTQTIQQPKKLELNNNERSELFNYFKTHNLPFYAN